MADTIAPAGMQILSIALRYNKPNKSENHNLLCFLKSFGFIPRISIFQYFEFINKFRFVLELQHSVVSLFIDSGAGIVSPIWLVLALVLNSENNFILL